MTTENTRAQKRKIAVRLLTKIYDDDLECLASIHTAEANEDWGLISKALDAVAAFVIELKRAIR
jgi:hypothetical protein